MLKAQSKLKLTKGEFISVNSTHEQAAKHGQVILCVFPNIWINNHFMLIVCKYTGKQTSMLSTKQLPDDVLMMLSLGRTQLKHIAFPY